MPCERLDGSTGRDESRPYGIVDLDGENLLSRFYGIEDFMM